jgi:hypothetical protein
LVKYKQITLSDIPTPKLGNIFIIPCIIFILLILLNILFAILIGVDKLKKQFTNGVKMDVMGATPFPEMDLMGNAKSATDGFKNGGIAKM